MQTLPHADILAYYTAIDPNLRGEVVKIAGHDIPVLFGYGAVSLPNWWFFEYALPQVYVAQEFIRWAEKQGLGWSVENQPFTIAGGITTRNMRVLPVYGRIQGFISRYSAKRKSKMNAYFDRAESVVATPVTVSGFDTLVAMYVEKFPGDGNFLSDTSECLRVRDVVMANPNSRMFSVLSADGTLEGGVIALHHEGVASILIQSSNTADAGNVALAACLRHYLTTLPETGCISYMSDPEGMLEWKSTLWKFDDIPLVSKTRWLSQEEWAFVHRTLDGCSTFTECASCKRCCSGDHVKTLDAAEGSRAQPDPLDGEDEYLGDYKCPCEGGSGHYPVMCRIYPMRFTLEDGRVVVWKLSNAPDYEQSFHCPIDPVVLEERLGKLAPAARLLVRIPEMRLGKDDRAVRVGSVVA